MTKGHVYVAGPMSWGNQITNILKGIEAADELMAAGEVPFLPHTSHFWDMINGQRWTHQEWLEYDHYWVTTAKAIIRLPGKSRGADQEVRWARRHGVPVFQSVEEFLNAQGNGDTD